MAIEDNTSLIVEEFDRDINKQTIKDMKKEENMCKIVWKHIDFIEKEKKIREDFLLNLDKDIEEELQNKTKMKKVREDAKNRKKEEIICNEVKKAIHEKQVAELKRLREINPNSEEVVRLKFELDKDPEFPPFYSTSEKEDIISKYVDEEVENYPKKLKDEKIVFFNYILIETF